jgi:hypothetical protein
MKKLLFVITLLTASMSFAATSGDYCSQAKGISAAEFGRLTSAALIDNQDAAVKLNAVIETAQKISDACGELTLVEPTGDDYCTDMAEVNKEELRRVTSAELIDNQEAAERSYAVIEIGMMLKEICK